MSDGEYPEVLPVDSCSAAEGTTCMTKTCSLCRRDKTKGLFSADQWQLPDESPTRTCYECNLKQCSMCFKPKGQREFDRRSWQLEDRDPDRRCLVCANPPRQNGWWKCGNRRCGLRKPVAEFSIVRAKHGRNVRGGSKQCDTCVQRFEAECAAMAQNSTRQSQKRIRLE